VGVDLGCHRESGIITCTVFLCAWSRMSAEEMLAVTPEELLSECYECTKKAIAEALEEQARQEVPAEQLDWAAHQRARARPEPAAASDFQPAAPAGASVPVGPAGGPSAATATLAPGASEPAPAPLREQGSALAGAEPEHSVAPRAGASKYVSLFDHLLSEE
jgi:hypothetical protein